MIIKTFLFYLFLITSSAIILFFILKNSRLLASSFRRSSAPKSTFPITEPFYEGYLKVSLTHRLWHAQYGNPQGVPVIVLHGGPGAGCSNDDMKFFDPTFWRIILVDQRGARRSLPFGELRDNTTQDLIDDLEVLRDSLGVDKWVIFGGSWGSTLALAYGESYPERVLGFILRGIFLAQKNEHLNCWYGMRDTFPEAWQKFNDFISKSEQEDLISAYYKRVTSSDPKIALAAARSFFEYDIKCSFLQLSPTELKKFMEDDVLILGVSRTFIHYSFNHFFLKENQLIDGLHLINHLPLIIVHGRYDTVTRANNAYTLHKLWPSSELVFVDLAGHSAMELPTTTELTKATEKMKLKIISSLK